MKTIDYEIISKVRSNAGRPVPEISKEIGVPNSTIYEKLKRQYRHIIKRHTVLLNFQKLGFHCSVHFAIRCNESRREELRQFLLSHPQINTLLRVNFGWDFLAEGIFRDLGEAEDFRSLLAEKFELRNIETFNVVEELKRESFLTSAEHIKA